MLDRCKLFTKDMASAPHWQAFLHEAGRGGGGELFVKWVQLTPAITAAVKRDNEKILVFAMSHTHLTFDFSCRSLAGTISSDFSTTTGLNSHCFI